MIKRIVFDFDCTIADTSELCLRCFHDAWEPHVGHLMTDEEILATYGLPEEGMIRKLMPPPWDAALKDLYTMYEKLHPVLCPAMFDGIGDLIAWLKEHIPLDLLTGKGAHCCDISLRQVGLEGVFDIIIPGDPERLHKVEGLRAIMERSNCTADELLYIGDAVSDITACKEAGVRCLSCAWSPVVDAMQLEALNPGLVFSTVKDLRAYLEQELNMNR